MQTLAVGFERAGLDQASVVRDEARARGVRRLHGRLDDHAEESADVVRRGESLAEASDRVSQTAALVLELVEPRL